MEHTDQSVPNVTSISATTSTITMKTRERTTFQEALSNAKARLSNLTEQLNKASAEIKEVESTLREHGLCFEVYYKARATSESFYSQEHRCWVVQAKFLAWIKDAHGKFRLQLANCIFDPDDEGDLTCPAACDTKKLLTVEAKPLIESKAEERLMYSCDLPAFLDHVDSVVTGWTMPF